MVLLVGDPGSGKTRLLRELDESPPAGFQSVYVPVPTLAFDDLATWCVATLGRGDLGEGAEAFDQLTSEAAGVLLLIDDADHLPLDTASRLAASVVANDGKLVVVVAACPGDSADAVARRLCVEQQIELTGAGGGLVHLGELQAQLLRGEARAPMARVLPAQAMPVAEVPRPEPVAQATPSELEADPDETMEVMPPSPIAAQMEPPREPLAPLVKASEPAGGSPAQALSWFEIQKRFLVALAAAVGVAFLLGVAYQLGRQSVQLLPGPEPTLPSVSAAPLAQPEVVVTPPEIAAEPLGVVPNE